MKTAAGVLVWRRRTRLEVLLAHPGGPFYARKDTWGIPKGEFDAASEDAMDAARREFAEEIGQPVPAGELVSLGSSRDGGKTNTMWAVEGDLDVTVVVSNTFEMAWPPRVGRIQSFPEGRPGRLVPAGRRGAQDLQRPAGVPRAARGAAGHMIAAECSTANCASGCYPGRLVEVAVATERLPMDAPYDVELSQPLD